VQYLLVECNGGPLIFVLKLDETKMQHGKKIENMGLTLMKRVLNLEIKKNDDRYFSLQLKQEIYPIWCFQVEKESYEILNWVF